MEFPDKDIKERFESYLKEKKGDPIDPNVLHAGRRELELGQKGDYPTFGDEPNQHQKNEHSPTGHLFKTSLNREELIMRNNELFEARRALVSFLESDSEGFEVKENVTNLLDLINFLKGEDKNDIQDAIDKLIKNGYGVDTYIYELPSALSDEITKNNAILKRVS